MEMQAAFIGFVVRTPRQYPSVVTIIYPSQSLTLFIEPMGPEVVWTEKQFPSQPAKSPSLQMKQHKEGQHQAPLTGPKPHQNASGAEKPSGFEETVDVNGSLQA